MLVAGQKPNGKSQFYELHGHVTLDFPDQFGKVQWLGIGGSHLWGSGFKGYSFGADFQFRF